MMHTKIFLLLLISLFSYSTTSNLHADESKICENTELGKQPILADGRVVPLFAHATRIRSNLFPKKTCPALSATGLYCTLSLYGLIEAEKACGGPLLLKVEHVQTKGAIGLSMDAHAISPEELKKNREKLTNLYHEQKEIGQENGGYAQDLVAVLLRLQKLEEILSGENWKILTPSREWIGSNPLTDRSLFLSSATHLNEIEKRNLSLETIYERFKPFSIAIIISLLGFLFSILSIQNKKFITSAEVALGLVIFLELSGITLRVLISGRGPVTNMYETVMWAGFCSFALSAILGFKLRDRRIWAAGFAGNSICLLMMTFATGMLDGAIQPLVPVLRDNFWLSTHVTSVTLSYSCFFLSWIIANFSLIRWILSKNRPNLMKSMQAWNYVIRISMQIGVVFLAAGVLLGGIWADYSWGRFWGWDPKETWSLIALIIYIIILHGKYVGWFKDFNFTIMAAFGFLFILMAWFGVNYILATGLHSYGFSSGGSLFLLVIFLSQLLIIGVSLLLNLKEQKRST